MSVQTCRTALVNAVATATSAPLKFTKLPVNPPARYPSVYGRWLRSVPSTEVFQVSSGFRSGKKRRAHTYVVAVLIGMSGSTGDQDEAAMSAADQLMNAINGDTSLGGIAVDAKVLEVTPEIFPWDEAQVYGIGARIEVTEEV